MRLEPVVGPAAAAKSAAEAESTSTAKVRLEPVAGPAAAAKSAAEAESTSAAEMAAAVAESVSAEPARGPGVGDAVPVGDLGEFRTSMQW